MNIKIGNIHYKLTSGGLRKEEAVMIAKYWRKKRNKSVRVIEHSTAMKLKTGHRYGIWTSIVKRKRKDK